MSNNISYYPEKSGLEILGQLQEDVDYEFHDLIVWKDEFGNLFYAEDSGCSCPTPFENYYFKSKEDHNLEEIVPSNLENFTRTVENFPVDHQERDELIVKVQNHLLQTTSRK